MSDTNADPVTPSADLQTPAPAAEPAKSEPAKVAPPAEAPKTTPVSEPAPAREPKAPTQDAVVEALKSLQRDNAGLEAKLNQVQKRAEAAEREAARFKDEIEGYVRKGREDAIVTGVRAKLPHASDLTIRGTLVALHEGKHIDRFAEKTDEAVTAALEAIGKHAPDLAKPPQPSRPGGPAGSPAQQVRRTHRSPF